MKAYVSNLIPRLQQFSQKLDNTSLLINKHWIVVEETNAIKTVYIFRPNNELLISKNGTVTKGRWEYIGNNSILIDILESSFLFKHGFFDDNVLALKIDSVNEYVFLVNETKYDSQLSTVTKIDSFLNNKYLNHHSIEPKKDINIPKLQSNQVSFANANASLSASAIIDPNSQTKTSLKIDTKQIETKRKTDKLFSKLSAFLIASVSLYFIGLLITFVKFQYRNTPLFWFAFLVGSILISVLFIIIYNVIKKQYKS